MAYAKTSSESRVTPLIVSLDTGESGEAYEIDVQTPTQSRPYQFSRIDQFFKTSDLWPQNSESGETYDREAESADWMSQRKEVTGLKGPRVNGSAPQ